MAIDNALGSIHVMLGLGSGTDREAIGYGGWWAMVPPKLLAQNLRQQLTLVVATNPTTSPMHRYRYQSMVAPGNRCRFQAELYQKVAKFYGAMEFPAMNEVSGYAAVLQPSQYKAQCLGAPAMSG